MDRWIRISKYMFLPIVLIFSFPWFFPFENIIHLAQTFAITYIVIVGLNIWVGLYNQLSLGHVGFYGIGAYGAAIFSERLGVPFLWAILLAGGIAGGIGVMLSFLSVRLRKLSFAMVTLVFGAFINFLVIRWEDVTGGLTGFTISTPAIFGVELTTSQYFWLVGIAAVLASYPIGNLLKGRYGRTFMALGNSEQGAQTVGISPRRWRIGAFAISAFLGGIGGGFFAFQNGFISSSSFQLDQSILFLVGVLVGGAGSKWGPLFGTAIVVILSHLASSVVVNQVLLYGGLLLLCFFLLPDGIVGTSIRLPMIQKLKREMGKIVSFHNDPVLAFSEKEEKAILDIQGLSLYLGKHKAVSGLDLRIKPGEIYGLIGPSCSGKSTTINLLSGVYVPSEGAIQWMGQKINKLPGHRIAHLGLTRTFQNPQVFQDLLVIENVMVGFHRHFHTGFFANLFDLQQVEKEEQNFLGKSYDLLRWMGLAHLSFVKSASLSNGEQRMVEMARALAMRPRLILLDAPFAESSPEEVERMMALICRLKEAGLSVLIVEHHMEKIRTFCDRIMVLDLGRKIAEGTPEELLQNENVN